MPDDGSAFAARMRAGRERWLRLDAQREVRLRRPAEVQMPALLRAGALERFIPCVVDWRGPGFTEAGLLGAALGSDAAVPFSPEAWEEYAQDNAAALAKVATEVSNDCAAHLKAREDAAGK